MPTSSAEMVQKGLEAVRTAMLKGMERNRDLARMSSRMEKEIDELRSEVTALQAKARRRNRSTRNETAVKKKK
ncbi:hypothetical protein EYR40_005978 [Pleurotus pulmonarius]|nr:hypothetical protein EYR36_005636 [Pleurotus pulmonarius]KAF4602761.1 hypothetical protein EYR40_005978 [Pleurotus pulmonarius]